MSKLKNKLIVVLAVLLCAMLSLSAAFLIPKPETAHATSVMSPALELGYGTNRFDGDNLNTLYGYIISGATDYDSLSTALNQMSDKNYGDIYKKYSDINNGNGVTVKFGSDASGNAYEWNIVAASKNQSGEVVVTLWLSLGVYNSTYSDPNFKDNNATTYAPSEYSMNLIRSTLVENAEYATSLTEKTTSDNSTYNTYWKNFLTNYGQFIDTPYLVGGLTGYQATQKSTSSNINQSYLLPNEAYVKYSETGTGNGQWGNATVAKVQDTTNYDNWKDDKLWLPSLSETGYNNTYTGLWEITNNTVRANSNSSWLRSSRDDYANGAYYLNTAGSGYSGKSSTFNLLNAVRPALHLNLSKAEEYSSRSVTVPTDVSNAYNGKAQTLDDLTAKSAWYNEALYTNSSKMKVEYVGNMTDVGEHTVKVTIVDTEHYYWADGNTSSDTRTFKYKITRAPLNVQKLQVDENGKLLGDGSVNDIITGTYLSTTLYERDVGKSTAPRFGVQYKRVNGGSWSTTVPESAGQYYVRAYLINDNDTCNYYLASDGQTTFTKPKEYVETPHFTQEGLDATAIVGSTTTVQYTGDYQDFKLVNTPDDKLVGVTIGERTGGLSYDQRTQTFRAKAVGIYTVEAILADGGANTQWDSSAEEISRTITLIITKAELKVNILESDMTSWTKGDIDYLTVQVEGVRNSENVKLDVYYTVSGSSSKTYVADSAMNLNEAGDTIVVTVNLATFDTNKEYQLFVQLRDNIAVNENYTIINNSAPYKFFIMTATINDDEVVAAWTVSNLISGTKEAENGIEVDYNGSAYTLALDESKLPKGFEFSYTNESFTDVKQDGDGYYTTKVILTCQSGYQLASGKSSLSFEITWKINPIVFDIAFLLWADNPEYNGSNQTIDIVNLPAWLAGNVDKRGEYTKKNVGRYTAEFVIISDGNYTFTYSGDDGENNTIEYGGQQATLKHEWEITKKIISVTNAPKQWTTEVVEYSSGETNYKYKIYVPAGLDEYGEIINVTYYSDSGLSTSVDIKHLEVDPETGTTYYIKIEIAGEYKSIYEMYNTLTKGDYAFASFVVGGGQEIIEVLYETADELMYNGQPQGVIAKYRDLQFTYTYYKSGESSPLDGAPTDIGDYRVVVAVDGENADDYWIQNGVFYYSIVPLVLTTDGYKPATGNQLQESFVISDADVDTSEYFRYEVYDKSGKVNYPAEQLKFNTTYTVKLVLTKPECSVWADDAVTTYKFTTSFDPNAETKYLDDPTITVTDKDGNKVSNSVMWTGEEFTVTINGWETLGSYLTVTVDGKEDDSGRYNFSAVGLYTLTVTIKEEALQAGVAEWLWDDGSAEKTVTFEITKRYVAIPVAVGEVEYTGETLYLFPDGYEEQFVRVNDGAVLSAVEIGGEWRVKLWLKDKENTCWADGTTDDLTFIWSIVEPKPDTDPDPDPDGGDDIDLESKKQAAKDALEEAAKKKKEEIDNNPDLTDEEKAALKDKVDKELEAGKNAIDGATTADGVDSSFGEAKKNIEGISAESGVSPFPWWILAIIAGALLFIILLIIIIVKRRNSDDEDGYDDFYDDEYEYDEEEIEDEAYGDEY